MNPLVIDRQLLSVWPADARLAESIDSYPDGIIIPIDKPFRWTSADVIRKLKFAACRHFGKKNLKVGHAGTLDPLATGVLLVCIGNATKLAEALQRHDKEYVAGISFGATTPSYDLEKEIDKMYPHDNVNADSIRTALAGFLGEQEQVAPLFSAKSVDGVRAYELARKAYREAGRTGGDFDHSLTDLLSRQIINISECELLGFYPEGKPAPDSELAGGSAAPSSSPAPSSTSAPSSTPTPSSSSSSAPASSPVPAEADRRNMRINLTDNSALHLPHADVRIACSKGTYIRAFARDLGEALDSGAHLDALCRSRSGDFRVENALTVQMAMNILTDKV